MECPFSEDRPDFYLTQLLKGSNHKRFEPYNLTQKDHPTQNQPTEEHLKFLLRNFGHRQFRPMQWLIISTILNQKRDNLAIMTTGYGKSLCYQYPSAYKNSVTLVVSPLISLMEDQILSLTVSKIPACLLGSAQSLSSNVIDDIFKNKYRLVYITPEYCTGDAGNNLLQRMNKELDITLIAVDEAHCVTSWGHDFRYSYRKLSMLKEMFPDVPILAVTATATPKVKSDIIKVLNLKNPQVLFTGFDRPNLYFSVFPKTEIFKDLKSFMVYRAGKWVFPGATIIYCLTRKQTIEISDLLHHHHEISCVPYHAGINLKERKKAHEDFVKDKVSVIIATVAFGMGIDKPDIRLIIHYGASNSIEAYYQEVGRAGRDGLPAKCVTFWSRKDFVTHSFLRSELAAENQSRKSTMANLMQDYLTTTKCRRHFILSHFEDNENVSMQDSKICCDNCDQKDKVIDTHQYENVSDDGMYDFTEDAVTFLSAIAAVGGKCGMEKHILFLRGSKSVKIHDSLKKHKLYGSGAHKSDSWWKEIANLMLAEKFLERQMITGGTFAYTSFKVSISGNNFLHDVTNNGIKLLRKPSKFILDLLKKSDFPDTSASGWLAVGSSKINIGSFRATSETELNSKEKTNVLRIYNMLLAKRTELASEHDTMPYVIASNAALMAIAKNAPKNLIDLRNIQADGFTEAKIEKFGPTFIKIINENCTDLNSTTEQDSIENILKYNPLENARMPPSALTTFTLYKAGKTVEEIMAIRKFAKTTIIGHLVDAMTSGYPVTLSSLGVTSDDLNTIVGVINNVDTGYTKLTPIKLACPEHVTYEQIKAVCTYLQVRDHLKNLGVPYTDFEEEYRYNQCELTQKTGSASVNIENMDQNSSVDEATKTTKKESDLNKPLDYKIKKDKGYNIDFDDDDDDLLLAACTDAEFVQEEAKITTDNKKSEFKTGHQNNFEFDDNEDDILLAACGEMEKSLKKESENSNYSEPPSKKTKCELDGVIKADRASTSSDYTQKKKLKTKLPPWLR